ncbi:replication endonuclease [Burkholderia vietnamiensis]|uniref:replication endonuclease n=1 Tax=Burkholderia vietnamiensis TaxID=60552 RepID=UPI00264BA8E0|nr:replication endonuclease [Burkholderia vietnamiensis]MDN7412895.1 replication endonuclease [Burkholderia vietnamiensis]
MRTSTSKNNINDKTTKVNAKITFDEYLESLKVEADFEDLIKEEEKEELFKAKIKQERYIKVKRKQVIFERKCPELFALVPDCQKSAVAWQIKNHFNNDPHLYCQTIPNFFSLFDKKKKAICDEAIALGDEKRKKKNKLRKDYLLFSSQLLNLVGGKTGSRYINDALLDIYVDDQKAQQSFYDSFRLVNAKGQVRRLVSMEKKKEVQRARILNISSALAQKAIDEGFTYALITFSLPPVFHGNAIKGSSARYQGFLPSDGQKLLEKMGQEFRALLAKKKMRAGRDYFGCSVFEAMRSSVGHKHWLVYFKEEKFEEIYNIVKGIQLRTQQEYGCPDYYVDIKKNDGREGGNGAAYIFKYITKTVGEMEKADDIQLRNMAVRWYHSARAFNFFGIKQAVTKFNFLCDCVEQYKGFYRKEIYETLSTYNYYEFISKYEKYFKIVRDEDKKVKFITFDLAGNFGAPQLRDLDVLKARAQVIIEKKVFSIFECPREMEGVSSLKDIEFKDYMSGAFSAWDDVKFKQTEYDKDVKAYALACGIQSHIAVCDVSLNQVMSSHFPEWKEEVNYFFSYKVTVKENLSSADWSASPKNSKNDVYSPRLSKEVNEKIKKLVDERRKAKGLN